MKKKNNLLIISLIITVFSFTLAPILPVFSVTETQEATKSSSPTPDEDIDKIQELKEKVAEKVSQLKEKEERLIIGTVIKKEEETLQIASNGSEENVTINQDTKLFWINTDLKTLTLSTKDLVTDDYLIAFGTYSHANKALNAQTIYGRLKTFFYTGKVEKIDPENSLTLIDKKKNLIEINIDEASVYKLTKKETTSVSNLSSNDYISIRGYENKQKLIAQRILILD